MAEVKKEKYTVRVIRKQTVENAAGNNSEQVDQIYEQEFDRMDIGKFATDLNRKDGKEKDDKSLKLTDNGQLSKNEMKSV